MQIILDNLPFFLIGTYPQGGIGGLVLTIYLACLIGVTSFLFAMCVASLALSPFIAARITARAIVLIVRGVPSLVFLFWMYFLIPRILMMNISGMTSAIVALTIYHGAYMAEDIRGGIHAVHKGQWEAARATGLPTSTMLLFIVFPQAIRAVVPALINRFVNLFMYTSVVSLLGILELTRAANIVNSRELSHSMEIFGFIGMVYFVFCYGIGRLGSYLESRWTWVPKVRIQQTVA
jgi:polar amino acid transport system permease protein